ncbi:uncharacterized protein IAS62_001963 [Cryptococcus decagattii]|uniref:Uncharacterized protein n=1 Tax=Cryptococcus decagattii TaxID=1859122 RepID=A0ABZ2AQA6_9TREE
MSAVSLVVMTSYSTIPHSPTSSSSPSGSAQVSDMRTLTAGASALSGTIFTEDRADIGALNSAHEFFNKNIFLGCSNDCEKWKQMAQICAEDSFICTSDTLSTASKCSGCIGSQSSNSTAQMSAYAAFVSNCTSASPLSGASASQTSAARLAFGGKVTSSAGANPFATASSSSTSVNAAEANGAATTFVAAGAGLGNADLQPVVAIAIVVINMAWLTVGRYVV